MYKFSHILKAIWRYKLSSGFSVLSLIISFFGIFLLSNYILFEKSFDKFHNESPLIYRLETSQYGSNVPAKISSFIKEQIPEVDRLSVLLFGNGKISTLKLKEENINYSFTNLYSENSFFDIFNFPIKTGEKSSVLSEPNTVVLTQSFSKKLFGTDNSLGESVFINGEEYRVSAIMEDFPKNSSFSADCISSFSTIIKNDREGVNSWSDWNFNIFLKLHPEANPKQVAGKIENIPDFAETVTGLKSQFPNLPLIILQPLANIHYKYDSFYSYTNPVILNVLIVLVGILIIMGAANFINFTLSQLPLRAKSFTVLRIFGGKKIALRSQIIFESALISFVAFTISIVLFYLSYASIGRLFEIDGLDLTGRYFYIVWYFLFALGFGIIASLYPSWHITKLSTKYTPKGIINLTSGKGKLFRNILITTQFGLTIILIASAFIIEKQIYFWQNFDIGINKDHVVYLNTTNELQTHHQAFADELLKDKDITDYSYSQYVPGDETMGLGRNIEGQDVHIKCWPVDDKFLDFFGIKINEGRKFRSESDADIDKFILNKKAVDKFNWQNPLEKEIEGFGFNGPVIGVIDNFNFSSLKEDIGPMMFWLADNRKHKLLLRIKPENYLQTINYIKNTAKKFDSNNSVDVKFIDDRLNQLYSKEKRTGYFIEFVALWCVLLAVTGLLGLVIFICRDRIKEIGIRKVNGAKVSEILTMLNKDFVKWVVIAFVIATPIAYYAMNKWLENFAYKTGLSWWIFALAGLLALGIALLTVSFQSWKAATKNPVESLRYE